MKLELKHIAPYLPYGLRGNLINNELGVNAIDSELYRIGTGRTIVNNHQYYVLVTVGGFESSIKDFKPILRPKSDLVKEITVNGVSFVPMMDLFGCDEKSESRFDVFKEIPEYWQICMKAEFADWEHNRVQKIICWHFDIYDLIGKGLAIDINSIKQ